MADQSGMAGLNGMLLRHLAASGVDAEVLGEVERALQVSDGAATMSDLTRVYRLGIPKIRGPNMDPQVVGLLFQGHPQTRPPIDGNSQVCSARRIAGSSFDAQWTGLRTHISGLLLLYYPRVCYLGSLEVFSKHVIDGLMVLTSIFLEIASPVSCTHQSTTKCLACCIKVVVKDL